MWHPVHKPHQNEWPCWLSSVRWTTARAGLAGDFRGSGPQLLRVRELPRAGRRGRCFLCEDLRWEGHPGPQIHKDWKLGRVRFGNFFS